jgi:alpha-L-arabinofuranosidase
MYGVFFEEISHSGDGGLYAEMIQNRGFEDKDIPASCKVVNGFLVPPAKPNYLKNTTSAWKIPWDTINKWPGWSIRLNGAAKALPKLTTAYPLNEATPNAMQIEIIRTLPKQTVELVNDGYWGISVKKNEKYTLRFYMRADKGYTGNVIAKLRTEDDAVLAKQEFTIKSFDTWNEYTCTFVPKASDDKVKFVLSFTAKGKVWVDYVSLFPEKTYKNRANGLRQDVAQKIAELKPAFVRWPGGCIVEGLTLENRVKWKETLGDPVTRPGTFDLWGYRNSYGFGYYEYLQFCEDIGTSAMFVCNAGLACANRNGDYCTEEELGPYVQDALDAIEYAIGDTLTTWGKKRAASGHPLSFPLKYIEVGNENYGTIYASRFNVFYKAIKEKYPQITVISTLRYDNEVNLLEKTDMIDPHYYKNPLWFYENHTLFDAKQPRPDFKVYVGEYACNKGVGSGNLDAALSEASFILGMERNSDLVTMCSYAPLIENSNNRNWPVNLIWLNNKQVMGRSSYYVQQMFAENRPTLNLKTDLQTSGSDLPKADFKGYVGLGTSKTQSVYKDFMVTESDKTIYKSDFINNQNDWDPAYGHWRVEGDSYIQGDLEENRSSFVRKKTFRNCTIEVKARKIKGNEGFNLIFGAQDQENYYRLNVGGSNNQKLLIEKVEGGVAAPVGTSVPFTVENDHCYNVKVITNNDEVECFVDGQSMLKYKIKEIVKRYALAGFDQSKNEMVLKVVNAESAVFKTTIELNNAGIIESKGEIITLSSGSKINENTFKKPEKIIPIKEEYKGFSDKFTIEFKPYSLTVLRIKIGPSKSPQ